jgi:hypothetical protein
LDSKNLITKVSKRVPVLQSTLFIYIKEEKMNTLKRIMKGLTLGVAAIAILAVFATPYLDSPIFKADSAYAQTYTLDEFLLTAPESDGLAFKGDDTLDIHWTWNGSLATAIFVSYNNGTTWTTIYGPSAVTVKTSAWTVPAGVNSQDCKIAIHTIKGSEPFNTYYDESDFTFCIDNIAPMKPAKPGLSSAQTPAFNGGTFDIAWFPTTDNTGGSGVEEYRVSKYKDGSWVSPIEIVSTNVASFNNLPDGFYTFLVSAIDKAGNISNWSDFSDPVIVDTTPPSVPGIPEFSSGNLTTGNFTIEWDPSTDIGGIGGIQYYLSYSKDGGMFGFPVIVNSNTKSYTGLSDGSYIFKVRARDNAANFSDYSDLSDPIIVGAPIDITPPDFVDDFIAIPGNTQVSLSWTNPTPPDYAGTLILRKAVSAPTGAPVTGTDYSSLTSIGDADIIYNGNIETFLDTGLSNGTEYFYHAYAYDTSLNYSFFPSPASATPADTTPPASVTSFTAAPGDAQVSLSWTNPIADYAGTLIIRATSALPNTPPTDGQTYFVNNTIGNATVRYCTSGSVLTDTTVINGITYYYKAYAYDASKNYSGAISASATPTAGGGGNPIPGAPTNLTINEVSGNIVLSWNASANADGYKVYRDSTPYFTPAVPIASPTTTSHTDVGMAGNTTTNYFYIVKAYSTAGESGPSDTIGEFDFELVYNPTDTSYTWISLPLEDPEISDAYNLATKIGLSECLSLGRWDETLQSNVTYAPAIDYPSVVPFAVSPGDAIRIEVNTQKFVTFTGKVPDPGSISFLLKHNSTDTSYNWLSLPLDRDDITNVSQLGTSIGNCSSLSQWNPDTQMVETFAPGPDLPPGFSVRIGYPYRVEKEISDSVWPSP